MRDFCTYFDHRYMPEGLALYRSLAALDLEFRLWVLCLDEQCAEALHKLALPHIRIVPLSDIENGDTALLAAKAERTRIEYIFTLTPSWPLYILNHHPEVECITYLDADLSFFADPAPLFEELGAGSIAIIAHRFSPQLKERENAGIYNVGWLTFKRDDNGLACLQWWRDRCLEWCRHVIEDGKYADQKYLDDWPTRFAGVVVLQHKGANLAPWNVGNYQLSLDRGPKNQSQVLVDGEPLLFYHFQGLEWLWPMVMDLFLHAYLVHPSAVLVRHIYAPYIALLGQTTREAARVLPAGTQLKRIEPPAPAGKDLKSRLRALKYGARALKRRERIIVLRGRVL